MKFIIIADFSEELKRLGWNPEGESDAGIIVPLYERYGLGFVSRLQGMFAIALYDRRQETLHLITDRVGKKPLFYHGASDDRVVFASELTPLRRNASEGTKIDFAALDQYLSYRIVPSPRTIYRDISRVPPGSIVSFERNRKSTITTYWKMRFTATAPRDRDELVRELRQRIELAVADRLEADVPIGATLSGGLDSSLVVSIASRLSPRRLKTFSVGFAQKEFDESALAALVARYCNTEHRAYCIDAEDARAAIDPILYHVGEPYAFPSAIASYYMFKLASQEVTVTLTGDGSDEAFGGYRRYRKVIEQLSPARGANGSHPGADGTALNRPSFKDAYHSVLASGLSDDLKARLYSEPLRKSVPTSSCSNYIEECEQEVGDPSSLLDRMMLVDFGFWLPDAQLIKIDRMAMAHSVEPRSPMLDSQLLEFVGGIPADLKLVGQSEKDILKRAACGYLPESIILREKQELAVPLEEWLSVSLAELVRETLLSETSLDRGYFQPDALRNLVNAGRREHSYALWTLFMLERWHQLTDVDGESRTMRAA